MATQILSGTTLYVGTTGWLEIFDISKTPFATISQTQIAGSFIDMIPIGPGLISFLALENVFEVDVSKPATPVVKGYTAL